MASTLILNAYDQNGQLVAQGNPGASSVTLKGIAPTDASKYQVAFEDGDGRMSPKVAIGLSAVTGASSPTSAQSATSGSASPASASGSASH